MLTSLDALAQGQPWPPKSELARLQEYADNRLLFEGEHPRVFNDWHRVLRKDQQASLEFVFNLFKRLSTLWADLLLGEPPRFIAGEEQSAEQLAVQRLTAENQLATTAYEVALDTSRYGDGLFKVRLRDGRAVIEGQPPTIWFPVVSRDNVRDVQAHVLGWTFDVERQTFLGRETTTYLRLEIHQRGRIEHRLHILQGGTIGRAADPAPLYPEWRDVEETGVDDFLLVPVAGLRTTDRFHGLDDYGDVISIVQELEVRVAQIARILDRHADPSLAGPEEAVEVDPATGERTAAVGGQYYPVEPGGIVPQYVTWEGQLEAAFQELELLIRQFYLVSETSPAAFGQLEQGLAESGSALRRLMMAPLAKVNRVRLHFDPALKRVLQVAAALERANGVPTPALGEIRIVWRDGLPEDPSEQATIESTRIAAGLTSRYSALRRLDGDNEEALQAELARIDEDEASAAATQPLLAPRALSQSRPAVEAAG